MQTLDSTTGLSNAVHPCTIAMWARRLFSVLVGVILVVVGGCSKETGMEAVETNANGYFCRSCKSKMFTARRVFLENCPQCRENAVVDVVGYWCEKDQHLTIRPKVSGPEGASACEKCGVPLRNAMVSPREKDLLAWGATKTAPPKAR